MTIDNVKYYINQAVFQNSQKKITADKLRYALKILASYAVWHNEDASLPNFSITLQPANFTANKCTIEHNLDTIFPYLFVSVANEILQVGSAYSAKVLNNNSIQINVFETPTQQINLSVIALPYYTAPPPPPPPSWDVIKFNEFNAFYDVGEFCRLPQGWTSLYPGTYEPWKIGETVSGDLIISQSLLVGSVPQAILKSRLAYVPFSKRIKVTIDVVQHTCPLTIGFQRRDNFSYTDFTYTPVNGIITFTCRIIPDGAIGIRLYLQSIGSVTIRSLKIETQDA